MLFRSAAAGGGARGEHDTEGEKEGEEAQQGQELTTSTFPWSARPEED